MEDKKELVILKSEISELEKKASEVTITNQQENEIATNLKAKLKDFAKRIKDWKEARTKPLNVALKLIREDCAPFEEQLEIADKIIGKKLLDYKRKVDEERLRKEKEIADKIEADRKKLEADVAAGKITETQADKKLDQKIVKAEDKIGNLEVVQKTIQTNYGQVQFRKVAKMRIVDESLVPDKYWVIDSVLLRKDVLAGIVVPGAERYEEETV